MDRKSAISRAEHFFDDNAFFHLLADWVALNTGSRGDDQNPRLLAYLEKKITPYLETMDFDCRIVGNPVEPSTPFLLPGELKMKPFRLY